jgi:hypothetical protein
LPADQRYDNAYLFGAICPRRGKGAALMLPRANTDAMQRHLDEISRNVAAKAHAVVLMDRAVVSRFFRTFGFGLVAIPVRLSCFAA